MLLGLIPLASVELAKRFGDLGSCRTRTRLLTVAGLEHHGRFNRLQQAACQEGVVAGQRCSRRQELLLD
jgi:hypothetical protein